MAIGQSRRIVIDLDGVELKRSLYSALAQDGRSLKEWFVDAASHYLRARNKIRQLDLGPLGVAEPSVEYKRGEPKGSKSDVP